jgi:hypothetical protein
MADSGALSRLAAALAANSAGSDASHVVIAMPSFSVGDSLLSHYGHRLPALEQRFLVASLMTHRLPSAEFVFVSSTPVDESVLQYYRRLGPCPERFAATVQVVSVDDSAPRAVAAKLLLRPDLLDTLRRLVEGRPAVLAPWNVTEDEMAVAEALNIPIDGSSPDLRGLGFKSEGRRLLRAAGVPVPFGVENVRSVDEVVGAIGEVQAARPGVREVVIKHDDSGAGDGNAVLNVVDGDGWPASPATVAARVEQLPDWYLTDLAKGGVVEERIIGADFRSPSAQIDILPDGQVLVLATHEQELGGDSGQVFMGCRFPADPQYAPELADHAANVGTELARRGVLGRVAIDFVASSDGSGTWSVYALEMNLRRGGTTHPYSALRNLVPGRYEAADGQWVAHADDKARTYVCSDNEMDDRWLGLSTQDTLQAVLEAGVEFDHQTGTGTVLHSLPGLAIDGRIGMTAIATDIPSAQALAAKARQAINQLAARTA